MTDQPLIYDWNRPSGESPFPTGFRLLDETLRDGIQSPSVTNPTGQEKLELLRLMEKIGIDDVDVGLPGAGAAAVDDCELLVQATIDENMSIRPNCAARTHPNDILAVTEVNQRTSVPIEVCAFLGCSPIRRLVEKWDLDHMIGLVTTAADICRKEGLPFTFVTEDTTRASPDTLEPLFKAAIDHGATRLILCDTCGHATPDGLGHLVTFTRRIIRESGVEVGLDWHGHNDRGLALPLCLTAIELGIERIHGTCMGIGERVGNAPLDLLMVNLQLFHAIDRDMSALAEWVRRTAEVYGVEIPDRYPVFGRDAFRTATGVHAAAIVKALAAGRDDLADVVYSSVPARDFGCRQSVDVGYYSGKANAVAWLYYHSLEDTPERVETILGAAKVSREVLTDGQIETVLRNANLWR